MKALTSYMLSLVISFLVLYQVKSQTAADYKISILKKHSGSVNAVAFSADDHYLFSGGDDKMMIKWELETEQPIIEVEAHYRPVKQIMCLNDGVTVFSAGDRVVKTWNTLLEKQDEVWTHHTDVYSFDLTSDNRDMISATYEKKPYIWDLYSDEIIARPEAHENTALAAAFSHNNKYFATGSLDQSVFIWNFVNKEVEKAGVGHSDNIYDIEFTPNDTYLISVSKDRMIKIWDVASGAHYKTLSGHTDAVLCVAVHPDSRFFLTGSLDQTIRLWDLKTGACIYTYIDHKAAVNDISFSSDGKKFATASADETVILWKFSLGVIATYYYEDELNKVWEDNAVFSPKRKNESRSDYLEREKRAELQRDEIYQKYYQKLLSE